MYASKLYLPWPRFVLQSCFSTLLLAVEYNIVHDNIFSLPSPIFRLPCGSLAMQTALCTGTFNIVIQVYYAYICMYAFTYIYLSFSGKDDDNAKKDELFSRSYNKLCIQKNIEAPLVFFAAHIT